MPDSRISLSDHLGMTASVRTQYMHAIGLRLQARWRRYARQFMADVSPRTRSIYRDAIEVVGYSETTVEVRLSNKFAAMFEQGLGPAGVGSYGVFDMRIFLLGEPKPGSKWPKEGPRGKWRPIPFVRSKKQMEEAVRTSSQDIARDVQKIKLRQSRITNMRKSVTREVTSRDGTTHRVIKSGVVPKLMPSQRSVFAINTETGVRTSGIAPPHRADLIAGTRKSGGKFVTFRVISWGAKPWYHPGIRPRRIARMVINNIKDILPDPRNPDKGGKRS